MSYLQTKTNYVRPHAKTSYIRPLSGYNDDGNRSKDYLGNSDEVMKNKNSCFNEEPNLSSKSNAFKHISDTKEKHIQNLSSAHTKLYDEIEKIQTWTATIELENKQNKKKVNELIQTAESQRKVVLDLQMQNENLSLKLSEEIQQRVSTLEKFYFTKELCCTLKEKFNDITSQFDKCQKIKEEIDIFKKERLEEIENLTKKYISVCADYSEKISSLNDALANEKHTTVMLKDLCEQQNANAEKEHKSFCKLIENYRGELKNFAKDLEAEKNKVLSLEHEKNNILQTVSHFEEMQELHLKKIKDLEEQVGIVSDSKLEAEKKYALEKEKVNDLNTKCEEINNLKEKQQTEYEEICAALRSTVNSLENSIVELKQKLEDGELNSMNLSVKLKEVDNEKNNLEKLNASIQKEKEDVENKLMINSKIADEMLNNLMKEKSTLDTSLKDLRDELQETLLEKENLSEKCLESEKKIAEITKEYNDSLSKIEALSITEKKYNEALKEIEEMKIERQEDLALLASKDKEVEKMQELDQKYVDNLKKLKDIEESLQSSVEQLSIKEEKIQELCSVEEKLATAEKKIKELEEDLVSKIEDIFSKETKIKELSHLESHYAEILEKVKKLENDIQLNKEQLALKEKMIAEQKASLEKYEINLFKLEYENTEMKDNLEKEKESVKVCLECEIMKDKVKEFEILSQSLKDAQEKLEDQRKRAEALLKMLSETEDNYDNMRINKEREIISYKDTIEALQKDLRIAKFEGKNAEKLKKENEKLQMNIEELNLQNTGDMQRLKVEKEKLKDEIEQLKKNMMISKIIEENELKKEYEKDECRKVLEDIFAKKQVRKSPFQKSVQNEDKMEADSSHDDDIILIKEEGKKSLLNKKFCKGENKKAKNLQKPQGISSSSEKRKRAWESESSGSECLEIVMDKDAKKFVGLTPKNKLNQELKRTPNVSTPRKIISSQDSRTKRDIQNIMGNETPSKELTPKSRTVLSFSTKPSPMIKKLPEASNESVMDFLGSSEKIKQSNVQLSPYLQRIESPGTQQTPLQRKFFKTPLKERDFSFKKPQQQNWF